MNKNTIEDAEKLTRAKASALALNMTVMRHDDGSLWLVDHDLFRELFDDDAGGDEVQS